MSSKSKYQILSVILVIKVAGLGSLFVNLGTNWFNSLIKPSQWIPNFVIPIVWTVIYLLACIYLVILIKNDKFDKKNIILFIVNGILNVLWCLIFFTLKQTFLGLIIIVINLVLGFILYSYQNKDNILAKLLLIYPLWLSVATCLNLCLWILN